MLDDKDIDVMAHELCEGGFTSVTDSDGNRMVIVHSAVVGIPGNQFILAYENKGTIFFDTSRPMNHFRLTTAGFSLRVAPTIADIVNRLLTAVANHLGDPEENYIGLVPIGESK